jgi:hypothetical protein
MEIPSSIQKFVYIVFFIIAFVIILTVGMNVLSMIIKPSKNPYLIKGLLPGNIAHVISQDPSNSAYIPVTRSDNESEGIEFSWSIWVNISDLGNNEYSHIFHKGELNMNDQGLNHPNNSPGLYIKPHTNELTVIMNTFTTINEEINIPNVPLNKWVHIVVRVEHSTLDVYINGSLAKRHVFTSVPRQNNGDVYISQNGGFAGYISDLRYYSYGLQPSDILALVNKGPNLTPSNLGSSPLNATPPYLSLQWYTQNV